MKPSIRADMVARVVAVSYPSGEPAAVEPSRIALSMWEDKKADGLPSESLLGAVLFGAIPVPAGQIRDLALHRPVRT